MNLYRVYMSVSQLYKSGYTHRYTTNFMFMADDEESAEKKAKKWFRETQLEPGFKYLLKVMEVRKVEQ